MDLVTDFLDARAVTHNERFAEVRFGPLPERMSVGILGERVGRGKRGGASTASYRLG